MSLLLHALLIWLVAAWEVTQPDSLEPKPERVVVTLEAPRAAPPPPPRAVPPPPPPPPPPPQAAVPPPAEAAPEPPVEEPAPEEPERKEVEVPLPEQQIVSMPDAGVEKPPPDTRFLSDRDNVVEQESVKRGEPAPSIDEDGDDINAAEPDAPEVPEAPAAEVPKEVAKAEPPKPAAPAPPPVREPIPELAPRLPDTGAAPVRRDGAGRPLPNLESLMPNALALAQQQAKQAPPQAEQSDSAGGESKPPAPAPGRQRNAAAWQPSTSLRGTLDHLPDVQAGNVTLLNTKAEMFAPFVRRVMLRVFQNMMILMKRSASSMRPGTSEQIQMEAIMSPKGDMISLRVIEHSASRALGLDRLLTEACNQAFFDRNPPPGAAGPDGNIHFIMQTVVQTYPAPGRQGIGLSGVFGVGLM